MSPLRMAAMTSGASSSSGCSRGWVTGVHGVSRRSAWPGTRTMSHRSWRSSSPGTSKMSSSSAASEAVICSRIAALIEAPTSTRTTSPKRRRRSSSSTARTRSSASSETVKSASRVTRKTAWSTISIPGKSVVRFLAIRSSSGTNVRPSPTGTKRGSISLGTFTRAKASTPPTGSRTTTPSDSERLEM